MTTHRLTEDQKYEMFQAINFWDDEADNLWPIVERIIAEHVSKIDLNLLTVQEVADHLRVSKMTVYRLIESERLRSYRIERSFRVDRADLDAYVRDSVHRA